MFSENALAFRARVDKSLKHFMRRTGTLALALGFAVASVAFLESSEVRAQPDSEETGDEPTAEVTPSKQSKKRAKQKKRRRSRVVGHAVPESQLRAGPLPAPSGHLHLFGLASREELELDIFNDDGSFDTDELHQASNILRCKRTEDAKPIDPRLLVLLSHVYDHFGKRIDIVSGYRNQRKQTSYHYKASASDIRIEGVPPKKIVKFASTLDTGGMGIGLYPRAKFVHIDVRPPPSYRWIDNARPRKNSWDKQPPRGWKRKKLQS